MRRGVTVVVVSVCLSVCPSVPALAASASVETSKQRYSRVSLSFSWINMCGVSKKPSIQKLWRGKANMQMSWSSLSAAFAQFRDQRNAAEQLVSRMLLQRLATGETGVKQARYRRRPTRGSEALTRACAVYTHNASVMYVRSCC